MAGPADEVGDRDVAACGREGAPGELQAAKVATTAKDANRRTRRGELTRC